MNPILRRSIVIVLRILSLAVLGLLVALVALPLSDRGTAFLLDTVSSLTPVEIEHTSGNLAGELRLARLALVAGSTDLLIEDALLELQASCLVFSKLCFRQLRLGSLNLTIGEGDKSPDELTPPAETETPGTGKLVLPVAIVADAVHIGELRVQWPGGGWQEGSLDASLALEGSRVQVSNARIANGRLWQLSSAESETVETGEIELPRIHIPLELVIEDLLLIEPGWAMFGLEQQYETIELDGSWSGTVLRLQRLAVERKDWGRLELRGELELDEQWPLTIGLQVATAQPAILPRHFQDRELSLQGDGTLAGLQLEASMAGSPSLELAGQVNALDRDLPFDIRVLLATAQALPLSELLTLPDSLAAVALESPLVLHASGSLSRQLFQLEAAASGLGYDKLDLLATGHHESGLLTLEQLELRDESGTNALAASGQVQFGDSLLAEFALDSPGMNLPELGDLTGRLQGRLQMEARSAVDAWAVSLGGVDIHGEMNAMPASVTGAASVDSKMRLAGSDLNVDLNGARLRLVAQQPGQAGRLALQVDDIGRWLPDSAGSLVLNARLASGLGDLTFEGSVEALRWQDQTIAQGVLAGSVQLEGERAFTLTTDLHNLQLGGLSFTSLAVGGKGTESAHQFSLSSAGDVSGALTIAGALQGTDWRGTLQPADWQTPAGRWQLEQAVPLRWSSERNQLSIAAHCWRDSQSELCPGELLLGQEGKATITGKGRLKRLAGLLPEDLTLTGQMQLSADAHWSADRDLSLVVEAATGPIEIVRDYGDEQPTAASWEQLRLDLRAEDGAWHLQAQARPGTGQSLTLDTALAPGEDSELSGKLDVKAVELAELSPFLLELSELQGRLDGALALSGTLARPLAHGELQLRGGQVELLGNPTVMKNIALDITAEGDSATVGGSATLGGGELQLSGQFRSQPELNLELNIVGDRHNVAYPPSTELVLSEDIQVTLSGQSVAVTGEVVVHEGKLQQEQLPQGSVGVSRDIVEVDLQGQPIVVGSPLDTRLDVLLHIRDKFSIVGNGLDAAVGGELQIKQRPGRPLQLFGNLNIIGGRLEAFKQVLQIKSGSIGFVGAPENPELNVRAVRDIVAENISVGVSLLGTLENPQLEVYSDPVMSETEALSYLVRGRGLDSGAGADGTALALSMGTSLVNQTGVLSNLERVPGLRNIQLGAEGSADETAATVSGYIGERIFISYGIGIYEPINVLVARLYLQTRLWLEVVSRLENSVDLYYSFDID